MLLRPHGDCTSGSPPKKSFGSCSEAESAAQMSMVALHPYLHLQGGIARVPLQLVVACTKSLLI